MGTENADNWWDVPACAMPDPTSAMSPAFRLLLACARLDTAPTDDAAIRACVAAGPDWTRWSTTTR